MRDGSYAHARRGPGAARRAPRPSRGRGGRRRARARAALGARDRDARPRRPAQGRRARAHDRARRGHEGRGPAGVDRLGARAGRGGGRGRARARPGASSCPAPVVEACAAAGVPLVAFRRAVRFVEITEAVHAAVLHRQFELLRRGEEIHKRFTDLILQGRGVPEILAELAQAVGRPVVLEDAAQRARLLRLPAAAGRRRRDARRPGPTCTAPRRAARRPRARCSSTCG